jgi:hypothetical protein
MSVLQRDLNFKSVVLCMPAQANDSQQIINSKRVKKGFPFTRIFVLWSHLQLESSCILDHTLQNLSIKN